MIFLILLYIACSITHIFTELLMKPQEADKYHHAYGKDWWLYAAVLAPAVVGKRIYKKVTSLID